MGVMKIGINVLFSLLHAYLTQSVFQVILQKPTPTQNLQLIFIITNVKIKVTGS